jgi:hypothetical protein
MSFNLKAALEAPFYKALGYGSPNIGAGAKHAFSNGFVRMWRTPANDDSIQRIQQVDSNGNYLHGDSVYAPNRGQIAFPLAANAAQGTQPFYISDGYYYLTGIQYRHHVAGTGTATSAQVVVDRGVGAPGSGSGNGGPVMSNTFNIKSATLDTPQIATLASPLLRSTLALAESTSAVGIPQIIALTPGDRLSFVPSAGTLTSLAGVCLACSFAPWGLSNFFQYNLNANGSLGTQMFANIDRPGLTVTGAKLYFSAAGTDAGTVTIDITQDTGTGAPGSGTSILSAPVSLKQTAGTTYSLTLSATAANLILTSGNRLSVKYAGALTSVAGVVVMVYTTGTNVLLPQFALLAPTATNQCWAGPFDREYLLEDASCIFSTAAGGASKLAITIDGPGVAPGAGAVTQTDNTNAGFDLNAAANTLQIATMASYRKRVIPAGYSLGMLWADAIQSTAGLMLSGILRPTVK